MSDGMFSTMTYLISSDVVKRLMAKGVSLAEALKRFYNSQVFAALSDRSTGLWRESTEAVVSLLETECLTGKLNYAGVV